MNNDTLCDNQQFSSCAAISHQRISQFGHCYKKFVRILIRRSSRSRVRQEGEKIPVITVTRTAKTKKKVVNVAVLLLLLLLRT